MRGVRRRNRYDDQATKKMFRKYALKGGKGARAAMTRRQYRAFLKRFDRSKWATLKKPRNGVLPESARPGRQPLYTLTQLREALESSAKKVWPFLVRKRRAATKRWHPVSKNPKHLAARAREALSETAWSLGMRPAHPKVLVSRYTMSSEYVRTKVRDSDDQQVRSLWKELVTAVENTEVQYRIYKATGRL
jgi:hypothetical protein